jgi:hypothetical protein
MARKSEEISIDGFTYRITQLGTSQGIPLGHRLLKVIGPVVVSFIEKLPAGSVVADEQLAGVVIEAMGKLPTELLVELAAAFQASTQYKQGNIALPLEPDYDDHFAGRYGSWLKWFIACARVNFTGFFSSSGSSAKAPEQQAPSQTPTS